VSTEAWRGAVEQLASQVDSWQWLQRVHAPDANGMCSAPGCGLPGYGTPVRPWPCAVRSLADDAEALHNFPGPES
jgi:hypothetical protein